MAKITFIGAGSTVLVKSFLGDCMLVDALQGFEFTSFDIDLQHLRDSELMLNNLIKGNLKYRCENCGLYGPERSIARC